MLPEQYITVFAAKNITKTWKWCTYMQKPLVYHHSFDSLCYGHFYHWAKRYSCSRINMYTEINATRRNECLLINITIWGIVNAVSNWPNFWAKKPFYYLSLNLLISPYDWCECSTSIDDNIEQWAASLTVVLSIVLTSVSVWIMEHCTTLYHTCINMLTWCDQQVVRIVTLKREPITCSDTCYQWTI